MFRFIVEIATVPKGRVDTFGNELLSILKVSHRARLLTNRQQVNDQSMPWLKKPDTKAK